jgi:hypothetical protein
MIYMGKVGCIDPSVPYPVTIIMGSVSGTRLENEGISLKANIESRSLDQSLS